MAGAKDCDFEEYEYVAHSLSANKRIRQNEKRRMRNRTRTSALKTEIRKVQDMVRERNAPSAREQLNTAYKKLDQVAAKGTIHRNKASRTKSRLAKRVVSLEKHSTAGTG